MDTQQWLLYMALLRFYSSGGDVSTVGHLAAVAWVDHKTDTAEEAKGGDQC